LLIEIDIFVKSRKDGALRVLKGYLGMGPVTNDGTRVARTRRELLNGDNTKGQIDKTEVGKGTIVPIM